MGYFPAPMAAWTLRAAETLGEQLRDWAPTAAEGACTTASRSHFPNARAGLSGQVNAAAEFCGLQPRQHDHHLSIAF